MVNIIFLDVDGVLNNWKDAEENHKKGGKPFICFDWPFNEKSMEALRDLVNETNSKIVITSSWRKIEEGRQILLNKLGEWGLKSKVIGYTPGSGSGNREEEIQEYLKTLEDKANFIILDDETAWYKRLENHVVEIDNYLGLQKEHVEIGIKLFELQNKKSSGW